MYKLSVNYLQIVQHEIYVRNCLYMYIMQITTYTSYMHARIHAYIHAHIYTRMHSNVHLHTLHAHTHTHTPVVYHHGKSSVGGHYTCDVRHTPTGSWLHIDDSLVKPVSEEAMLKHAQLGNKVAYLLFYRRVDFISN